MENREAGKPVAFIAKAGVLSGHYYGWFSRNSEPKYPIQKRIADAYGVSVDWLNSPDDAPPYAAAPKQQAVPEEQREQHPPAPQPDHRDSRDTATLDRLLTIVERQESIIESLSVALENVTRQQEPPLPGPTIHRVKRHPHRSIKMPSYPGRSDK